MSGFVDLHIHTTASDGTLSLDEIALKAKSIGLEAIAVTDHDTVSGIETENPCGIEVVPGIEFSTKYKTKLHLLGYFIDIDNSYLKKKLQEIVDDRDIRNEKIVSAMRNDGINITYDEMKSRFGELVGRPHFAEIIVENGICSSISEAFDTYLSKNKKYWFRRTTLSIEECVGLITGAGGIAVIAHPYEYKYEKNTLKELIDACVKSGVRGIECSHSSHTPEQISYLEALCDKYGLLKTGGSDFHGDIKPDINLGTGKGQVHVPYEWLNEMKEYLR